jgi:hypothetical protein
LENHSLAVEGLWAWWDRFAFRKGETHGGPKE